jgi:glycosyltransferase involved in cell wall biosynthesis
MTGRRAPVASARAVSMYGPPDPRMARDPRRPIRVLQLADVVNRHDFIDVIVEYADPTRFDVSVATFGRVPNIADPGYVDRGVRLAGLGAGAGRRSYPRALGRLRRLLLHWRIDVVHCHHYDPAVLTWFATRCSSVRFVVGRHYSDAIELNTTGLRRRAYLGLERRVLAAAASTIVPSTMIAGLVETQGVHADRVHLVPYAFVAAKYEHATSVDTGAVRRSVGLRDDDFVVGTFARLYADKGHRYLLAAVAALVPTCPELRWLVVGDGAERASLESQVRSAGLGRHVRFVGWRRDALPLMAATDVVVQPTLQEAFSQVMGEAMWLERPLVMTDVSGATDIVEDGVNGFVVPKRDPSALGSAILRLHADEHLRREVAAAGRRWVTTELTPERVVPRYEAVYERALDDSALKDRAGRRARLR